LERIERLGLTHPAGIISDPRIWHIAIAAHPYQEADHGALILAFALVDDSGGDQPIEGLPDRHRLVGLNDPVDGVFDGIDIGFGAASAFCGASTIRSGTHAAYLSRRISKQIDMQRIDSSFIGNSVWM
jgi:hypothetical protein